MMRPAPVLLRLALRNLRRQARRSLLSAAAMIVCVALLVFSRALAEGGHEEWIDTGVRLGTGHITLQAPGYKRNPSLELRLSERERAAAEAALADPEIAPRIVAVAPRLEVQGLASSARAALPVAVLGIDPEVEPEFSLLADRVVEGRTLAADDRLAAYVGADLARRLGLRPGSRFVVTAQDARGDITGQMLRVVGVFRTRIPDVDEGLVQVPLATAGEWLAAPGSVSRLAVLLRSSRDVRHALEVLRARLSGRAGSIRVLGWREAMPELDAAVRVDDVGDWMFHLILFAIAALVIVNTVLMSVMYRVREFGVVRALGMLRSQVGRLVLLEGTILTLAAGLAGMIVGYAGTFLFFRDGIDFSFMWDENLTFSGIVVNPVIVPVFHIDQVLQSLAFVIGIGILASLYPAIRATRIDVAEAMQFDR